MAISKNLWGLFESKGECYLTITDRCSGWICIYHFPNGSATSNNLTTQCRTLFMNYGTPDELSSDGGAKFTLTAFTEFLQTWSVFHCLSSVSYPQSNGRAKAAVKTSKHIIQENTASNGSPNTDGAAKPIMQYCNTPITGSYLVLPRYSSTEHYVISHQPTLNAKLHKNWILSANQQNDCHSTEN